MNKLNFENHERGKKKQTVKKRSSRGLNPLGVTIVLSWWSSLMCACFQWPVGQSGCSCHRTYLLLSMETAREFEYKKLEVHYGELTAAVCSNICLEMVKEGHSVGFNPT